MAFSKLNIFKLPVVKKAKYYLSESDQIQSVVRIRETRDVSIETYPVDPGCTWDAIGKKAWHTDHSKEVTIDGLKGRYLPVTDRSRFPFDPFDKTEKTDAQLQAEIDAIAANKYSEQFADVRQDNTDRNEKLVNRIFTVTSVLLGLCIIIGFIRGWGS